jgi:AcrR family transcriptional regulator
VTSDATPPLTGGARTRARILDAAARLMTSVGLVRTTTKEIAREAGCSEAALYKHFPDKEQIFIGVLRERTPRLADELEELLNRAGEGDVAGNLRQVARTALAFYRQSFPMAGSLFASPELLAAHRRRLDPPGYGPQRPTDRLTGYLAAEQRLGRLSPDVAPEAAAAMLIGACFHRAFLTVFWGPDAPEVGALLPRDDEEFAVRTVRALMTGAGLGAAGAGRA